MVEMFCKNLQLHNLNYRETPQKIVPIVIWQQWQLYDISNHVYWHNQHLENLNLHNSLQLYTHQ